MQGHWRSLLALLLLLVFSFREAASRNQPNYRGGQGDGSDLEVDFVTVIYRHGDRTPIDVYPNDPYKDPSHWPVGFGQLTPRGKRMQFQLGRYLRSRYGYMLGDKYSEKKIYVRSSNVDRTLMSAESNLAGLYPPRGEQVWNKDIPWQPIPVHTVNLENDELLTSHADCPRYQEMVEAVFQRPEMKKIDKEYQWLYDYLTENIGDKVGSITQVGYLYDTLFIEDLYNKTLPKWTESVFPDKMRYPRDLSFTVSTWTPELKRLRTGPLVTDILETFRLATTNASFERKMNMYSAHDTTISSLLNGLGIFDPVTAPPYASCVMVELLKPRGDSDLSVDNRFVRIYYRNDSRLEPRLLTLPGCDATCPLEKFDALTKPIRPANWKRECRSASELEDPTITVVSFLSGIIGIILLLVLVVAVLCKVFQRERGDASGKYVEVDQDYP